MIHPSTDCDTDCDTDRDIDDQRETLVTHIAATLHVLGLQLTEHLEGRVAVLGQARRHGARRPPSLAAPRATRSSRAGDEGAITIEQVLWAVAAIAFVGVATAAVSTYVANQAGNIR